MAFARGQTVGTRIISTDTKTHERARTHECEQLTLGYTSCFIFLASLLCTAEMSYIGELQEAIQDVYAKDREVRESCVQATKAEFLGSIRSCTRLHGLH